MSVAHDNQLQEAEQFARTLFLAQPNLGIDDAARRINETCKRGLVKPTISTIRREVRQRLEAEALFSQDAKIKLGRGSGYVIRKKMIFNPPRIVVNPLPLTDVKAALESMAAKRDVTVEENLMSPAAKHHKEEKPLPASAALRANKHDRLKFLESWALENPLATIEQCRSALREQFNGVAMGTKAISDTLRMSRQLWETQRKEVLEKQHEAHEKKHADELAATPVIVEPGVVLPAQQQIAAWAQGMKAAGIRLIEITAEGRVRVEFQLPS